MPIPPGSPADGPAAAPQRVFFTELTVGGVVGGSLTGILELLAHLDRRRFEPVMVFFEPKPVIADLEARGIAVHVLPGPRGALPLRGSLPKRAVARTAELFRVVLPRVREFVRFFRRERPAVVYACNGLAPSVPVVAAAGLCGIPVVCHVKGFSHYRPDARFVSRWIDTAIGMTEEIVDHVRAQGIRARRFLTIHDGIDLASPPSGGGASVRREFGIPADAPLVGVVGHIQPWKGQLLAVEAVARARREVPDLRCLVVGGVHRQGVAYAEELRARIAAPDLAGHVILTGARRDVLACMDAMDVVLHTSVTREPFGRVMIEAMAVGRPVIAPAEGGPRVIVADGETGLLVPPRDPDALAAAMTALLTDPTRRAAMGRAGRARVEALFDIRQHARAVEAVLDDVLTARAGDLAGAAAPNSPFPDRVRKIRTV
jgi:glycosyltransferase involved in cell wall biosynthesis